MTDLTKVTSTITTGSNSTDAALPRVPVIQGPTASGKTAVAVWLAERLNGEVISADSRQFYREMSIGTAKPVEEEMRGIPHHFIGFLSVTESYTAGQFEADAGAKIEEILKRGKLPIIAGGSGLYVKALLDGLDDLPSDPELRNRLQKLFSEKGLSPLAGELYKLDPTYAAEADTQNPVRMIRALELIKLSGKSMAELHSGAEKHLPFTPVKIGLDIPRAELYARINARTDQMMADGLIEEARSLLPYRSRQALQTVGYKELFDHFDGECTLETATAQIKQNTRRYAKRQLTWLRRDPDIRWTDPVQKESILRMIRT